MGRPKGFHISEEHKAALRAARLGSKMSEETKAKIAAANRGRRHSEETKAKIGAGNRGKVRSPEARERLRQYALENLPDVLERLRKPPGWSMPQEARDKIAAAHRGRKDGPMSEERKAKISAARTVPLADRFWSHCDQTGECWLWLGSVKNSGYGMAYTGMKAGRAIYRTAHRVAYELAHGVIPHGMQVMHTCDVKLCVNPDHLSLGTHADNMRDMASKGRQWKQKRRLEGTTGSQTDAVGKALRH
jgi:hypothetical protein